MPALHHPDRPDHPKTSPLPHATVHLATTDADVARCFPVMHELRPKLQQQDFVYRIRSMHAEGYQLALLERADAVLTVAGFRIMSMLVSGQTLYVDDLVTSADARSQGNGEIMLHWLIAHARSLRCDTVSLDSGTHRQDAHAFYLRHRLRITSFHFALPL